MTQSRGILAPRHLWSEAEIEVLKKDYPDTLTKTIAEKLNISLHAVYGMARKLNLNKSQEFNESSQSGRLIKGTTKGAEHRFVKGLVTGAEHRFQKGLTVGIKTRFQKGQAPKNTHSLGSEVLDKDGYLKRKVSMVGTNNEKWRYVHVLNWEAVNGAVPACHMVMLIDGDKQNVDIGNLQLISFAENMKRNSLYNYPENIQHVIKLRGAITKRINKMERNRDA